MSISKYCNKIELHLHTPVISACAKVAPKELVERYHAAGYAAITVTDHFFPGSFSFAGIDLETPGNKLEAFWEGFRQVQREAEQYGIKTYYGAELRFAENSNDYLLYGFSDSLMADPIAVHRMGLVAFSRLARQDGAVLIQAHPFRTGCVPVAPCLVDGYEAINRHDKHQNRNELATALAEQYHSIKTSGSDFHDPEDRAIAGIAASYLPEDSFALAKLIRSEDYYLLGRTT